MLRYFVFITVIILVFLPVNLSSQDNNNNSKKTLVYKFEIKKEIGPETEGWGGCVI